MWSRSVRRVPRAIPRRPGTVVNRRVRFGRVVPKHEGHEPRLTLAQILAELDRAIGEFAARRAAEHQEQEKQGKALEAQAAECIEEALLSLRANSSRDRRQSTAWYVAASRFRGLGYCLWVRGS